MLLHLYIKSYRLHIAWQISKGAHTDLEYKQMLVHNILKAPMQIFEALIEF